jgi:cell division transport system permease protein
MKALHTALINMRRSPYQTLAAILIMTITFFVGYSFSLVLLGSETILKYFEQQPQVIGFFELTATQQEIDAAAAVLKSKSYVTGVDISSKEQALELYSQKNQDKPLMLELVTAEILPASLEVSGQNLDTLTQIKADLEAQPGINDVAFLAHVIEPLRNGIKSLRLTGLTSTVILVLTSIIIVMIITSMKITTRRNQIQIMSILGASRGFIKWPFVIEGMLYGVIGSLVGWSLMFVGFLYLTPWVKQFIGYIPIVPVPPTIWLTQLAIGTLAGIFIGCLASLLAVGRFLRK